MFKTKRTKELEACERELYFLKMEISAIATWCAADSPEIGFAMRRLLGEDIHEVDISLWRDKLRKGEFTWQEYIRPSPPKPPENRIIHNGKLLSK